MQRFVLENIGAASVAVLFRLRGESQKEFPAPDFHPFGLDVSAFGDARFGQRFQVGFARFSERFSKKMKESDRYN